MARKIRVVARRRKRTWVIHRKGKRIIAHARKKSWSYLRKDIGKPGKGNKVVKIKRPGLLNSIAMEKFGKRFSELNAKQIESVIRTLKRRGYTEKQIIGMMQVQVLYRKGQRNGVKKKFELARKIAAKKVFPP